MVRRAALVAALLSTASAFAQPRPTPLTRGLADALYAKLAGGSSVAGTTTFANITVSGTCTGCTAGAVPTTRLVSTTAPLGGGGDLSTDRTLTCTLCLVSGGALGTPSSGTGTNITGIPEAGVTNLTTDLAGKQATGNYITALTGHVVASGPGSVAATIQSGVVTLAMQADMATASLVYRKTAGSGAPEINTLVTLKTDLGLSGTNSGDQTITGGTCTNQFVRAISSSVVPTCNSVADADLSLTAPALGAPTATTIQTSGNVGFGTTPSATTGRWLNVLDAGDNTTIIDARNSNASGTTAAGVIRAEGSTAIAQMVGYGAADNATVMGVVNGSYAAVLSTSGNGFLFGTTNSAPVRIGTANTLAATVDTSQNFTFSGAVIPSQTIGITGTTTNNNANAGAFGEYQTGTVAANTTSLSTGTTANVGTATNITLGAGDWDCSGVVNFTFGATTSITNLTGGISTTTGTLPAQDSYFDYETSAIIPTGTAVATWVVPTVRLSNSGSTNVFLVSQATFSASTLKVGGTIRCRRMR